MAEWMESSTSGGRVELRSEALPRPRTSYQLLAELHHDLNNTLQAATLHLELLSSRHPPRPPDGADPSLDRCRRSLRRLDELLAEMERLLHERKQPLPERVSDVAALVLETATIFGGEAKQRAIGLETVLVAQAQAAIAPRQLFRVLANLIGNAVKYAAPATTVRITVEQRGGRVFIDVEDHGPGIAPEDCARLFDRQWLALSSLRRGRGLGLAIVRRIVEAHGGTVAAASRLGHGSRFTIGLPAAPSP